MCTIQIGKYKVQYLGINVGNKGLKKPTLHASTYGLNAVVIELKSVTFKAKITLLYHFSNSISCQVYVNIFHPVEVITSGSFSFYCRKQWLTANLYHDSSYPIQSFMIYAHINVPNCAGIVLTQQKVHCKVRQILFNSFYSFNFSTLFAIIKTHTRSTVYCCLSYKHIYNNCQSHESLNKQLQNDIQIFIYKQNLAIMQFPIKKHFSELLY